MQAKTEASKDRRTFSEVHFAAVKETSPTDIALELLVLSIAMLVAKTKQTSPNSFLETNFQHLYADEMTSEVIKTSKHSDAKALQWTRKKTSMLRQELLASVPWKSHEAKNG